VSDPARAIGDRQDGGLAVRCFEGRDQCDARGLVLAGLGEHFGSIDESLNPDLDDIEGSFLGQGHDFFVGELNGHLVGTCGVLYESPSEGRIVRMSVARHARRSGVASALLTRAIEAVRARSGHAVVARTQPEWRAAVAFYRQAGFEPYDADPIDVHLRLALSSA
jgi:GNAT superfamily N-acetyltransferase